jgi:ectoine hydroxylase-related dioxygenase (phytanoyl-CoA dioxygenase family)
MQNIQAQFQQQGYYLAQQIFSPTEVAELTADFDRIVAQLRQSGESINARWENEAALDQLGATDSVVFHTNNVHQYSAAWLRALQQEKFLEVSRAILGPDIVLHHNKLFQKPAGVGAPFPMHQDWSYFPTRDDSMIAAIIHLTDATDEMGCLRVYPGSNHLGRLADSHGQNGTQLGDYPLEGGTPVEAQAGDVVFFHYFTLHGSLPNRSDRTRKTVLIQMHAGTDEVEPGTDHPNERLVLSGWNHASSRTKVAGKR